MTVDISKVTYAVVLTTETGETADITGALLHLSWEHQPQELARRATLSLQNARMGGTFLSNTAKLGCPLAVYADWGVGRRPVFEGTVWSWSYKAAIENELELIAYDPLIRLQKSKDSRYYSAGMATKALIEDICGEWEVPVTYEWESIIHEKKPLHSQAISDMIVSLLDEVKDKTGSDYVLLFRDGTLHIRGRGINDDVYWFTGDNVISTSDSMSLDDLVTRVKIIGKENNEGRSPVEAIADGNLEFGVFQEILVRDSDKSLEEATKEAQALIDEHSDPSATTTIDAPDLPFLEKGDKIKVTAGNLDGYFLVDGVSHDATTQTMKMDVTRAE